MIEFKKLTETATIPKRQTEGAAGFDIHADIPVSNVFNGGEHVTISTGIAVAIPRGWVGIIKPRSGWAVKHGIDTMAGVIDSDYRGEIKVILTKHTDGLFCVNHGDRIAQLVVVPCMLNSLEVTTLSDTTRGVAGFGSTGV